MIDRRLANLGNAATLAVLLVGAASGACFAGSKGGAPESAAPKGAAADARRAEVHFPNNHLVVAEIADTPERQMKGYMFRTEVRAGEGMVFLFAQPDIHPFWMKNTLVPLDIIWMDDAATIVDIEANTPPCKADPCPSYGPMRKTSTVLEVRAGTAAAEGLKNGDRLRITIPQSGV